MRYEGNWDQAPKKLTSLSQAALLIKTFLEKQPERTANTSAVVGHLCDNGLSERTAERALEVCRKGNVVLSPKHGQYQLTERPVAA
jgi:hypothetical protein